MLWKDRPGRLKPPCLRGARSIEKWWNMFRTPLFAAYRLLVEIPGRCPCVEMSNAVFSSCFPSHYSLFFTDIWCRITNSIPIDSASELKNSSKVSENLTSGVSLSTPRRIRGIPVATSDLKWQDRAESKHSIDASSSSIRFHTVNLTVTMGTPARTWKRQKSKQPLLRFYDSHPQLPSQWWKSPQMDDQHWRYDRQVSQAFLCESSESRSSGLSMVIAGTVSRLFGREGFQHWGFSCEALDS